MDKVQVRYGFRAALDLKLNCWSKMEISVKHQSLDKQSKLWSKIALFQIGPLWSKIRPLMGQNLDQKFYQNWTKFWTVITRYGEKK